MKFNLHYNNSSRCQIYLKSNIYELGTCSVKTSAVGNSDLNSAAMQMLAEAYASEGTKVICISIHNMYKTIFNPIFPKYKTFTYKFR